MYRVILILLILVCSAASAGARHHRHRYHVLVPDSYLLRHNAPMTGRLEPYQSERSRSEVARSPASSRDDTGGVIPPDWKKQPLDNGGRFLSPDGSASFAFYTTAGHDEPIVEHMKSFAFGDGEDITSLTAPGYPHLDSRATGCSIVRQRSRVAEIAGITSRLSFRRTQSAPCRISSSARSRS